MILKLYDRVEFFLHVKYYGARIEIAAFFRINIWYIEEKDKRVSFEIFM